MTYIVNTRFHTKLSNHNKLFIKWELCCEMVGFKNLRKMTEIENARTPSLANLHQTKILVSGFSYKPIGFFKKRSLKK